MRKLIMLFVLILSSCMLIPSQSFAAAGDVIFSACGGTCSDSYAGGGTGWRRTVVRSGCVSGECLRLDASRGNNGLYGSGNTRINVRNVSGHDEITVVYYVKLNPGNRSLKDGNIKGIRPYISGNDYIFTAMDAHFGFDHYSSYYQSLTLKGGSAFSSIKQNSQYCSSLGSGTYSCPKRMDVRFRTSDGKEGFPSGVWRKVRRWIKLPTSSSSSDGESKFWIDEELVYHAYNVDRPASGGNTFTNITFYPSSEAGEPFEHWVDEMTIYEGYVPPGGGGNPSPPTPTPEDPEETQPDAPKNLRIVGN